MLFIMSDIKQYNFSLVCIPLVCICLVYYSLISGNKIVIYWYFKSCKLVHLFYFNWKNLNAH